MIGVSRGPSPRAGTFPAWRGNGSHMGPVVKAYARYLSGLAIRPSVDARMACHRVIQGPATGTQKRTFAPSTSRNRLSFRSFLSSPYGSSSCSTALRPSLVLCHPTAGGPVLIQFYFWLLQAVVSFYDLNFNVGGT